ncbi:MAG TPA: indole-3-glycerol phosphate synthase TrpC, partial [Actinomycetota bacterium]
RGCLARLGGSMGFLTDLTTQLRRDLADHPLDEGALMARATARPPARDFEGALRDSHGRPAIIAEVKRASPSAGSIAEATDPVAQASAYEEGGAAAVSVLTEPDHFHGSLLDLEAVRAMVQLPVMRKDFLVHPAQLIEARAHGADAVLLITSSCSDAELTSLLAMADDLGLGVVLETHSDEDLVRASATDASIIGVNARNLETLEVDVPGALSRLEGIARERVAVMESGIATRRDALAAVAAGASAILVGEALMRAADPSAMVRELTIRNDDRKGSTS